MEALKRYRTGGEQKVTVQHVTVSEGGNAIVGNVTQAASEPPPDKKQPDQSRLLSTQKRLRCRNLTSARSALPPQ